MPAAGGRSVFRLPTPGPGRSLYRVSLTIFDSEAWAPVLDKDIFSGLVRLHVLYHASHEDVFGLGLIEELTHHGYKVSPGTLYPLLHGLEKAGYLTSTVELVGKRNRRVYAITADGRKALTIAKTRVWELFREFFEEELTFGGEGAKRERASPAGVGKRNAGHD